MFWRVAHDTLKWMWPALFGLAVAVIGTMVGASQVWPEVKRATESDFQWIVSVLNNPLAWAGGLIVFLVWLAAFVWSGHKVHGSGIQEKERASGVDPIDAQTSENEFERLPSIPGYTAHLVLKLHYFPSSDRRWVIEARDQAANSMLSYFAPNESFTLAVRDRYGDEHSLPIPFTRKGIPFAQMIHLSLSVGSDFKRTVLRVRVNGRTIAQRTIPLSLGLLEPPWGLLMGDRMTTGIPITGSQGAGFDLYEFAAWEQFLGSDDEEETARAFISNWQLED